MAQYQRLSPADDREKSILICPECWHESPLDGDWIYREGESGDDFECPECGTAILTRGPTPSKTVRC